MLFQRGVRGLGFSATFTIAGTLAGLSLLGGGLLPLSCSSKDDPQPAPAAYVARFELPKNGGAPDLLQVPFPSDLMLAKDGTIVLPETDGTQGINKLVPSEKGAKYIVEALAHTHGFGTYAGALFAIDGTKQLGAPDAAKLPTGKAGDCTTKDATVFYFDVDATGGGQALECQAAWSDDTILNPANDNAPVLVVRTARGVVLPEGHKIVVLLTDGVASVHGAPLTATAQFAALRDGTRADDASKSYGAAIDAAAAKIGFDKKRVVAAAVYTTGKVTEELRNARELANGTAVPTLKWGKDDVAPVTPARFSATAPVPAEWTATLDDWLGAPNKLGSGDDDPDYGDSNPGHAHDAIAAVGTAAFDAPNFLIISGDYGSDPKQRTFFHGADGKVAINPDRKTSKIWVSFAVPKGTMPAAGWPVMVFQHGMGGQRGDMLQIANSFAHKGWATASIEVVEQGTRAGDATARGDKKSDYERSTSKYKGPDGFIDRSSDGGNAGPFDLFGGLFRLAALRDQFRQSAVDHATLARLLKSSPTLEGLAQGGVVPKIDGSKTGYMGDSLGGILGALTAGIEPEHKVYILNVPGGALLPELAANSPAIYSLLNGSASLNFGFRFAQLPPHHPLVQLMQHVIDGGDPIAVAPFVSTGDRPRNVLLIEVLGDELVSNESTEALARGMGLPVVTPHAAKLFATLADVDGKALSGKPTAKSTGALIQVYPAQHGGDLFSKKGQRQYAAKRSLFGDASTEPFPKLATPIGFDNPYLELQAAVLPFIGDAFDGKVPTLVWTKAPTELKDP